MSDGLCKECSLNDHQHHKLSLGGICIGCGCGFRPVARRHEVIDRERRLEANVVESLLRGENDRLKERIVELEQRVDGYSAMCAEQEDLAARSEVEYTAECLAHAVTTETCDMLLAALRPLAAAACAHGIAPMRCECPSCIARAAVIKAGAQ